MKVFDLSLRLSVHDMVFPGTPPMSFERTQSIDKDHYNLGLATINTHAGTHTDAPMHFLTNGSSLADVDFTKYVGNAVVVDCSHKGAFAEIGVQDVIRYEDKIKRTKRVLVKTNWHRRFNSTAYFTDYPTISLELAQWLVARKVVLLGVEPPSLNPAQYIEVHKTLLEGNVAIIEGLARLDQFDNDEIFFSGAPIAFQEGDGFPLRAVAVLFDTPKE